MRCTRCGADVDKLYLYGRLELMYKMIKSSRTIWIVSTSNNFQRELCSWCVESIKKWYEKLCAKYDERMKRFHGNVAFNFK